MENLLIIWLPYWLLGLAGIFGHIISKAPKGEKVLDFIKANSRDLLLSLFAYHILIFFWIDSGIEFIGMVKDTPNGLTFMLGWFGQSVLGHLVKQFEDRMKPGGGQ